MLRRLSWCCLAVVIGTSCAETPIWSSDPVPLLQAIAQDEASLITEWIESGADLNQRRPIAEAGPSVAGAWRGGNTARPLELAVALGRTGIALSLIRGGAAIEGSSSRLVCLTALRGTPPELDLLHAHGASIDPAATCDPEHGTVAELARRNSDAMMSAVETLGSSARH